MIEGIASGVGVLGFSPEGWPLAVVVVVLAARGVGAAALRLAVALVLVSGIVMPSRQPFAEEVARHTGCDGRKLAKRLTGRT